MKKTNILLIFFYLFIIISCKKDIKIEKVNYNKKKHTNISNNSFKKIKDTTIFDKSSEGTEIKLFKNFRTNDSIIIIKSFGETGNKELSFTFNTKLLDAKQITNEYFEPIYLNSNPKIRNHKVISLSTSSKAQQRLINSFNEYKFFFVKNNLKKSIPTNWIKNFHLDINKNSDNWQEARSISLTITKDSIIYEAAGYQVFQKYLLKSIDEKNNALKLSFEKLIDGTESRILNKTKDFGTIIFDGENYIWQCPYIDMSFTNDKKESYILEQLHEK